MRSEFKKGTGQDLRVVVEKRNRLGMNTKIKTEERVRKLVKAIGKEIAPRRQLIADLGLRQDSRRNFYRNYMYPARDRGLVVMEYLEVPSKPEQAYKLTEKGQAFWEELKREEEAGNGERLEVKG